MPQPYSLSKFLLPLNTTTLISTTTLEQDLGNRMQNFKKNEKPNRARRRGLYDDAKFLADPPELNSAGHNHPAQLPPFVQEAPSDFVKVVNLDELAK